MSLIERLKLESELKSTVSISRDQYEYDLVLTTTTTLTSCFNHRLPAAALAQWVEAWTAGWTAGVRIPPCVNYFVIIFLNFFELFHLFSIRLRSGEIGR